MKTAFVLALTAFLFAVQSAFAVDPPCPYEPCSTATWIEDSFTYSPNCSGCSMTVSFIERANDCYYPPVHEIQLLSFVFTGDCYDCYTSEEIFMIAYKQTLLNSGFLPPLNQCYDGYEVQNVACWKIHIIKETPTEILWEAVPCNVEDCCWYEFRICNIGGQYTIYYIDSVSPVLFCGSEGDDACWYVCEWIYDYYNPGPAFPDPSGAETERSTDKKSYVKPNPSNDEASLYFISGETGNFTLEIFDINGNIVEKALISKNSSKFIYKIKLGMYENGVYFYNISSNKEVISNGKFNVVK